MLYQEPLDEELLPSIPFGKKGGEDGFNFFIRSAPDLRQAPPVEESENGNKILIQVVHIYREEHPDDSDRTILRNRLVVNRYFNPMELVRFEDYENDKKEILCALQLKKIAEAESQELLLGTFVILVNIISIFISVGIITKGAVVLVRLAALIDIAVSATDILMQNKDFKQYLIDSGILGEWLVENWTKLSLITGTATVSLELISKFAKNADEIIDIVSNAPKSKFPKESIDEVVEEINVLKKKADDLLENRKVELKLKGVNVELKGFKWKSIEFTKRTKSSVSILRNKFGNSSRKLFIKEMLSKPGAIKKLKNAGLSDLQIEKLRNGGIPTGWNIHHKLPLEDGGINEFKNLILIKNDPYHYVLTAYQNTVTKGLKDGSTLSLDWPVIEGFIYP